MTHRLIDVPDILMGDHCKGFFARRCRGNRKEIRLPYLRLYSLQKPGAQLQESGKAQVLCEAHNGRLTRAALAFDLHDGEKWHLPGPLEEKIGNFSLIPGQFRVPVEDHLSQVEPAFRGAGSFRRFLFHDRPDRIIGS